MSLWKVVGLGAIALAALLLPSIWGPAGSIDAHADGTETVTLCPGCNPVAMTYPDNTPIETIAGAVLPHDILRSIWKFENATGTWLGYSPVAPPRGSATSLRWTAWTRSSYVSTLPAPSPAP